MNGNGLIENTQKGEKMNRQTGLIVITSEMSNPNGDPDSADAPRTLPDGRGWITDLSIKRRVRNLLCDFTEVVEDIVAEDEMGKFEVLLKMGANATNILKTTNNQAELYDKYFDMRLFGHTLLEETESETDKTKKPSKSKESTDQIVEDNIDKMSKVKAEKGKGKRYIQRGCVQIGNAVTRKKVDLIFATHTVTFGVQDDKGQGMSPHGKKFVEHGVYFAPVFINPRWAKTTKTTNQDIEVFKRLLGLSYKYAQGVRNANTFIKVLWYKHDTVDGDMPDEEVIRVLNSSINDKGIFVKENLPVEYRDKVELIWM